MMAELEIVVKTHRRLTEEEETLCLLILLTKRDRRWTAFFPVQDGPCSQKILEVTQRGMSEKNGAIFLHEAERISRTRQE